MYVCASQYCSMHDHILKYHVDAIAIGHKWMISFKPRFFPPLSRFMRSTPSTIDIVQ